MATRRPMIGRASTARLISSLRSSLRRALIPVAGLACLIVVLHVVTGSFLSQTNVIALLTQVAVLGIVVGGVALVIASGALDLSVGSQVAVHSVIGALAMAHSGSIPVGIAAASLSGCAFGLLNGVLVAGLHMNTFIVTLGTHLFGRGLALAMTDARPVTDLPTAVQAFGTGRFVGVPWIVWLAFAAVTVASILLHRTPFGLQLAALGSNKRAAVLAGVRAERVQILAFVIAGVFSAIAAIGVTLRLRAGLPTVGTHLEILAIAAVVIGGNPLFGGKVSMWRAILGVLIIGSVQNGLSLLGLAAPHQQIAVGVIFLLVAALEGLRYARLPLRWRRWSHRQFGEPNSEI